MNYIEVKITTTHDDVERICAMLSPLCSGFIIDDPQDVYEFSQEKTTKWDYIDDALLGNPDRDVTVTEGKEIKGSDTYPVYIVKGYIV